jgi:hypothetical protein
MTNNFFTEIPDATMTDNADATAAAATDVAGGID